MRYFSRTEVERIGKAGGMRWVDPRGYKGDAYRFLSSFWLFVEKEDDAFTPHAGDGFWEAWITKWLSEQLEDAKLFIDVGANVGYYTLMAATSGIHTVAIEPQSRLCGLIRASLEMNNACAEVLNYAVSNTTGHMTLAVPDRHSGGAYLTNSDKPEYGFKMMDVQVRKLDNLVGIVPDSKVVIKIDAEGAEPRIWAGMEHLFAATNCTVILEWESARFDCEQFGKALLNGGKNYVAFVNGAGGEEQLTKWQELQALSGLQMIVVRKQ
jgi:FkbM family methyltransferase